MEIATILIEKGVKLNRALVVARRNDKKDLVELITKKMKEKMEEKMEENKF